MANRDEAVKILRVRAELSSSRNLTEVIDNFHSFEVATNKAFNKQMDRHQQKETERARRSKSKLSASMTLKYNSSRNKIVQRASRGEETPSILD